MPDDGTVELVEGRADNMPLVEMERDDEAFEDHVSDDLIAVGGVSA